MSVGRIMKAVGGAVVAAGGVAITALEDGLIAGQEWISIVAAGVVALGAVWAVPNLPRGVMRVGKAITAAAVAALGALSAAWPGGVTSAEWITLVLAVLGALGITYGTPNANVSDQKTPR